MNNDDAPLELGCSFKTKPWNDFCTHCSLPSGDTIDGKLCFVTVGYLLQRLVNNPEAGIVELVLVSLFHIFHSVAVTVQFLSAFCPCCPAGDSARPGF